MIPSVLLRCYGVSEDETRNRCCRLFNEILVHHCESEDCMYFHKPFHGQINYLSISNLVAMARAYGWFYQQLRKSHQILQFQESEETMPETSLMFLRSMLVDWKKYIH